MEARDQHRRRLAYSRSRSPSPKRDRERGDWRRHREDSRGGDRRGRRERSSSRDRDDRRRGRRERSRSRERRRRRSTSRERDGGPELDAFGRVVQDKSQVEKEEQEAAPENRQTDEEKMMALMGFSGFNTTKGTAVKDNQVGPAKGGKAAKNTRKYRQYMNRKGGFNRALDN
mmetsp:Transcript_12254/g.19915  ORF Transcript_12254/g.19915 Transcript_12254/m.19915 type:complete len:172 (+) Transcript_12254:281-796(+)